MGGRTLGEGRVNKVHCGLCENGEVFPLPGPPYDTKNPFLRRKPQAIIDDCIPTPFCANYNWTGCM